MSGLRPLKNLGGRSYYEDVRAPPLKPAGEVEGVDHFRNLRVWGIMAFFARAFSGNCKYGPKEVSFEPAVGPS